MKKILFLIQSYPPIRSANALCDEKIIHALQDTGQYEIYCLAYQYNSQLLAEMESGIEIRRFQRSKLWNLFEWAKEQKPTLRTKTILKLQRLLMRFKQILTIPIYPCYEPFLAWRFAKEAIRYHQEKSFDLVVSEHNGFDTLYAGYQLKRHDSNIKYMPIFWDSLSGGFYAKYLPKKYCLTHKKRVEKRILTAADQAIIMKSYEATFRLLFQSEPFYSKVKVLNIPYLVQPDVLSSGPLDREKMRVVFAGELSYRDPSYIIRLFHLTKRKDIILTFICHSSYHHLLKQLACESGVQIETLPYMSRDRLQPIYHSASVLLNIGVDNPNAVSGKIFEYMAYGKPIISTYFIDTEACIPYLNRYPDALLIDQRDDMEINLDKLTQFLSKTRSMPLSFASVESLFPESSPHAYVHVINELLQGGRFDPKE